MDEDTRRAFALSRCNIEIVVFQLTLNPSHNDSFHRFCETERTTLLLPCLEAVSKQFPEQCERGVDVWFMWVSQHHWLQVTYGEPKKVVTWREEVTSDKHRAYINGIKGNNGFMKLLIERLRGFRVNFCEWRRRPQREPDGTTGRPGEETIALQGGKQIKVRITEGHLRVPEDSLHFDWQRPRRDPPP